MLKVLEECRVAPPSGSVANKSIPLTCFDTLWVHFHPVQRLLFYEFPHSESHFRQSVIPALKTSLSLALKHFYILAGSFIFPLDSSMPEFRYQNGDSIPLTFAESNADFNHLIGYHARNANDFHPLVPILPPSSESADSITAPLLAIQATLFPHSGICIGFAYQHFAADGRSLIDFIRAWGLITKLGGDAALLASEQLPLFDRTVIKDPNGIGQIFWARAKKTKFDGSKPQILPTDKVRATFVMGRADVQRLKNLVQTQCPTLLHLSTFTITSAYVWASLVKARIIMEEPEVVGTEELEHFLFAVDCRGRLNPPVPENYFGNCIVGCFLGLESTKLVGDNGLIVATEAIGEAIHEKMYNDEGPLKGFGAIFSGIHKLNWERVLSIAGSPKFSVYEIDFGWGRPKKNEIVSIDVTGAISFSDCRDAEAVEVGVSLPKIKMDVFTKIFADGLNVT